MAPIPRKLILVYMVINLLYSVGVYGYEEESQEIQLIASNDGRALKRQFAASREIADLSKKFIMVNAGEREDPAEDPKFSPDDNYVPRILFLSPDGELRVEFYNEAGDPAYKYFYADISSILATMNKVAQTYKKRDISKKEMR